MLALSKLSVYQSGLGRQSHAVICLEGAKRYTRKLGLKPYLSHPVIALDMARLEYNNLAESHMAYCLYFQGSIRRCGYGPTAIPGSSQRLIYNWLCAVLALVDAGMAQPSYVTQLAF